MLVLLLLAQAAQPLTQEQLRTCSSRKMLGTAVPDYCPRERKSKLLGPTRAPSRQLYYCYAQIEPRRWLVSPVIASGESQQAISVRFGNRMVSRFTTDVTSGRCEPGSDEVALERQRQLKMKSFSDRGDEAASVPFR